MGSFSIFHWLLVLAVILILFGAGKLPSVMGDLAKGIKAFRSGMKDDGDKPADPAVAPAPSVTQAPPAVQMPHGQVSAAQPAPAAAHPAPPTA